jgi:hypothetical protein
VCPSCGKTVDFSTPVAPAAPAGSAPQYAPGPSPYPTGNPYPAGNPYPGGDPYGGAYPQDGQSPLSKTATVLLCWFLGYLGVHRFFAGKIGTGILMLITAGGFGIWTIIDFIMICLNRFTDSNGLLVNKPCNVPLVLVIILLPLILVAISVAFFFVFAAAVSAGELAI